MPYSFNPFTGTFDNTNSKVDASDIITGTLSAARLPVFNGDITTTVNGSVSSTVVAIQGSPISTQPPVNGQVLQWTGTTWTPGAITTGGSGGGGLVYYLNFANQAQSPTTNLPTTPNTPRELGAEGTIASSSVTKNNVSTVGYDLICGFVSLTGSPGTVTIPAGLWDFNIWASATSTVTKQTSLLLNVYKYSASNTLTLLASSGDIFIYDPIKTVQYIASVIFPQTTLLETDRIYIELTAKATQNNRNITIYFGGTTPTHVHTTFPNVRGSGLVKVISGVYQNPASLLVNADVASDAAIQQSKIANLTTDLSNKVNKAGDTMTGKLNLPASTTATAGLNLGNGVIPTTTVAGDVFSSGNNIFFKGTTGGPYIFAYKNDVNTFLVPQIISTTSPTGDSAAALRITQTGGGEAFRVEDQATFDSTAFVVSTTGRVGVGVTPDATVALSVDSTGIKLSAGALILSGVGSPEGVVAAPLGSMYLNSSGGVGATLWVKESGLSTNTGWAAK